MKAPNRPLAVWRTSRCTAGKSKSMKRGRAKSAAAAEVAAAIVAAVVVVVAEDVVLAVNPAARVIKIAANTFLTNIPIGGCGVPHPPCAPSPGWVILGCPDESGTTNRARRHH